MLAQPAAGGRAVFTKRQAESPEFFGMIEVHAVRDLMRDDVIERRHGAQYQPP